MVLVDTSVWIDHLRTRRSDLRELLEQDRVLCHPFVIGELALGSLKDRELVLRSFNRLPRAILARETEVVQLISGASLFGTGIGYVDAHLLASVRLTPEASLWTRDKRLGEIASKLSLVFHP